MLEIDNRQYSPQLIILDKDGTLIEFGPMWHAWFDHFMAYIEQHCALSLQAQVGLAGTLGVDVANGEWDPLGPLTLASTSEILLLVASQLYQYESLGWDQALALVREAEDAARGVLADDSLLAPIGDIEGKLRQLSAAGYLLALATTDTRASTISHLRALGGEALFGAIVCGDDGIPLKPAPDMATVICTRLGVAPAQAIMIGDTVGDMTMARAAGLGAAIGVASGAVPGDVLRDFADGVVDNIHAIRVLHGEM